MPRIVVVMVAVGEACGRNVEDREEGKDVGKEGGVVETRMSRILGVLRSVPAQVTTAWEQRRRMRRREKATV